MGGRLLLVDGKKPNRNNCCLSGYQKGTEYFALSNFEDNNGKGYFFSDPFLKDPKGGLIHFPTAEHYLHFQKIKPSAKAKYYADWAKEKTPGAILAGIRDPNSKYYIPDADHAYMNWNAITKKFEYNKVWDEDKKWVQLQINATKYHQSPAFKLAIDQAIALGLAFGDGQGPATIIEDTSSLAKGKAPEEEWGTGPAGIGKNILGNSQTAFAKMIQANLINTNTIKLTDFQSANVDAFYVQAETQYKSGIQPVLKSIRHKSGFDKGLGQPDTSDLSSNLVQRITVVQGQIQLQTNTNKQSNSTSSSSTNATSSGIRYYNSTGGNQRLIIQNEKVTGYEFRKDAQSAWQTSGDSTRFKGLEQAFYRGSNSGQSSANAASSSTNNVNNKPVSAAEKLNHIKHYIENNHFTVGDYLLWQGGLMLKLEDGTEKRVPHRVYEMYQTIRNCDVNHPVSAQKAWETVQTHAQDALDNPRGGRDSKTTAFYNTVVNDNLVLLETNTTQGNKPR